MSFGFSIGDIVLLSKLAYDLYTSVSAGRKAASRDLQELEDVLFSLRCALDHLSEVSKDVLAKTDNKYGGTDFKANLNRMIAACGATLEELDGVTKKYREVGIDDDSKQFGGVGAKKKRTFDEQIQRMKVNWKKVRWDQEKQSLQSYREKLRTHTDAINIILTSILWSRTNSAETSSNTNHERTHTLLNRVLDNPPADTSMLQLLQEIHAHLTQPKHPAPAHPQQNLASQPVPELEFRDLHGSMGKTAHSGNLLYSVHDNNFIPRGDAIMPSSSLGPKPMLSLGHHMAMKRASPSNVVLMAMEMPAPRDNVKVDADTFTTATISPTPRTPAQSSSSTATLNHQRRTVGIREYRAYQTRHSMPVRPVKPSFLSIATPTVSQLKDGLEYLFRPLPEPGTNQARVALTARHVEITRWIDGFAQFVKKGSGEKGEIDLLVKLNEAIEDSSPKMKARFYTAAEQASLAEVLERLHETSKSVRVMKEIEEFQDAKDDWEDERD